MPVTMDGPLTEREKEILIQVGRGLTNSEIAAGLFLSLSTVKGCLHSACIKIGVRNRAQAAITAMRCGLLDCREVYSVDELGDLIVLLGPDATRRIYALLKAKLENGFS